MSDAAGHCESCICSSFPSVPAVGKRVNSVRSGAGADRPVLSAVILTVPPLHSTRTMTFHSCGGEGYYFKTQSLNLIGLGGVALLISIRSGFVVSLVCH